ncbi:N-acetylmuramoyl-L-alanine amidase, partial [Escherichia coli]|nr:N-acetylmuramoyl-L-alanine amidase [Escherichia coli]
IIVLDAGHGGKDPGTSGNELFEKEITLDVEKRVEAKLKKAGANVILTRSSDTFPTLEERVGIAKRNNAEIFVSIHANSGEPSANGTETYY